MGQHARHVVQHDFVIAADGQPLAVGRKLDGRHDRGGRIFRRMLGVVAATRRFGSIVDRPLSDPAANQVALRVGQRRLVLWHRGLAVGRCNLSDQVAGIRVLRHNRRLAAFATAEHRVERRHHVLAAGLGRLVTALALRLKDGANIFPVADRLRGGSRPGRRLLPPATEASRNSDTKTGQAWQGEN